MNTIKTQSNIFEDSRIPLPLKKNGEKPEYYLPEEIVCAVTHAIGGYLGAAAVVLLVLFAIWSDVQIPWKIVAGSIFGAAIIILYSASTLYHAVTNYRMKKVFQSVDEMAIYIMIAATYTPFCLVILRQTNPVLSWTIFGTIWGMALLGILFKLFGKQQSKYVTPIPYLVMGWFGLVLIKPLIDNFAVGGFVWLILGGVLYSLGVVFYLWRNLPYNHAVWHVFVLAGTIAHFFCILFYVIM
ncbi:MAG: hemolysin III family protein [Planctomycetaceae bacterium]|nr:hemolysin III family protein [Planctomycetaceae bacterium]